MYSIFATINRLYLTQGYYPENYCLLVSELSGYSSGWREKCADELGKDHPKTFAARSLVQRTFDEHSPESLFERFREEVGEDHIDSMIIMYDTVSYYHYYKNGFYDYWAGKSYVERKNIVGTLESFYDKLVRDCGENAPYTLELNIVDAITGTLFNTAVNPEFSYLRNLIETSGNYKQYGFEEPGDVIRAIAKYTACDPKERVFNILKKVLQGRSDDSIDLGSEMSGYISGCSTDRILKTLKKQRKLFIFLATLKLRKNCTKKSAVYSLSRKALLRMSMVCLTTI